MNISEVVKLSEGPVHLSVNDHKTNYETIEEYLRDEVDIPDDVRKSILENNVVYQLQFYPITPIGFYTVYDCTLEGVVTQALEILDSL